MTHRQWSFPRSLFEQSIEILSGLVHPESLDWYRVLGVNVDFDGMWLIAGDTCNLGIVNWPLYQAQIPEEELHVALDFNKVRSAVRAARIDESDQDDELLVSSRSGFAWNGNDLGPGLESYLREIDWRMLLFEYPHDSTSFYTLPRQSFTENVKSITGKGGCRLGMRRPDKNGNYGLWMWSGIEDRSGEYLKFRTGDGGGACGFAPAEYVFHGGQLLTALQTCQGDQVNVVFNHGAGAAGKPAWILQELGPWLDFRFVTQPVAVPNNGKLKYSPAQGF
mgnify:CR=1 FL=1